MTPVMQFWVLIVLLGACTWSIRAWPIILHGRVPHPVWLERFLKHVPVAALTALVVPGALYMHEGGVYSFAPARALAAAAALLTAWRTRSVFATLAVGMGVLWVAQWALSALH